MIKQYSTHFGFELCIIKYTYIYIYIDRVWRNLKRKTSDLMDKDRGCTPYILGLNHKLWDFLGLTKEHQGAVLKPRHDTTYGDGTTCDLCTLDSWSVV